MGGLPLPERQTCVIVALVLCSSRQKRCLRRPAPGGKRVTAHRWCQNSGGRPHQLGNALPRHLDGCNDARHVARLCCPKILERRKCWLGRACRGAQLKRDTADGKSCEDRGKHARQQVWVLAGCARGIQWCWIECTPRHQAPGTPQPPPAFMYIRFCSATLLTIFDAFHNTG